VLSKFNRSQRTHTGGAVHSDAVFDRGQDLAKKWRWPISEHTVYQANRSRTLRYHAQDVTTSGRWK
jgi:hypothetical protein